MRIAISQPEHFPYLGYFEKMVGCDLFIILDHVQFSGPRSFQNRNRFTDKNGKQQWFTVPVAKDSYFERIDLVHTGPDYGWRKKLIRTLNQNFRGFDYENIYSHNKLIDINMHAIELCRNVLGITTPMIRSSTIPVSGAKSELIYNLCKHFNADVYVSGQGARSYLENVEFSDLQIKFLSPFVMNNDSVITLLNDLNKLTEAKKLLEKFY